MKKLFSVILILLLTGCVGAKNNLTPVLKGISFDCEATYYNEVYECKGNVKDNGETVIEFITPTDIEGLKFTFSEKGVKANFKDIEHLSQKIVFENSVATLIYEVLSAHNNKVLSENDTFYTEGVTKDFEYKLELGGTGLPIKITTRPDAAEIIFKNVKIK